MNNAQIAVTLFESITNDDLAAGAIHFEDSAEWVEIPLGLVYHGPQGWHENVEYWAAAFSDGWVRVTNVIDGGDQVVVEYTGGGVNTGTLITPEGEIPPNGRNIEAQFVDVWQFHQQKITGGRSYVAGLMTQLARPK